MNLKKETRDLLASLNSPSHRMLANKDDLGTLLELGSTEPASFLLAQLAFEAKFISKTSGIMKRIGKDGEGYDRVLQEFTLSLERGRSLLLRMIEYAPVPTQEEFRQRYLAMTPDGLQHLLSLCADLTRYKNWQIDHRLR
jgi:hypothetical protein